MRKGEFRLRTLARLLATGILIFGMWGLGMVLIFHWLGLGDASENTRHLGEAELRPDRAHFRPVEGAAPLTDRASLTYVPVYSTLYMGDRQVQVGLAVTLSLRNTSPDHDLVVHRVDFYDTAGALTLRLADRPHVIPPMATAEFFIDRDDPIGGPGANYIVEWSKADGGTPPLIEAVMIGRRGYGGITLVSRGSVIRSPKVP